MAVQPQVIYPGQVTTGDPGYPHGKAKNQNVVGDGTGTPWEEQLANDLLGFEQALLVEAGATPTGIPDKVGASQYLDAIKTLLLTAQTDIYALNWRSFAADSGLTLTPDILQLAACQDTAGRKASWLVAKYDSTGLLVRSRTYFQTWEPTAQVLDGLAVDVTHIWGDVDRSGNVSTNDLLVINNASKLWQSLDAGDTWSSPITLGAVCTALARSHPLGLVIVAGTGVIKTLSAALGSLTSRTVPAAWAALTAAGIAVARGGESASAGAVIWPAQPSLHVLHSPDGVTWTDSTVTVGRVTSACWSEAHRQWFALTELGRVFSSPNPSVIGWLPVVTLTNTGVGQEFYSIRSFGRSVVVACGLGAGPYSVESGTLIVSQNPIVPESWRTLTTGVGKVGEVGYADIRETTLVHYDGQLVAGHVHAYSPGPTYSAALSVSLRAPWA